MPWRRKREAGPLRNTLNDCPGCHGCAPTATYYHVAWSTGPREPLTLGAATDPGHRAAANARRLLNHPNDGCVQPSSNAPRPGKEVGLVAPAGRAMAQEDSATGT